MTPQEKAKELVEKFDSYVSEIDFFGDNVRLKNAKECALIAVDELINDYTELSGFANHCPNDLSEVNFALSYWQEVRTEIEKL